jgi:TolA-binding protein
MMGVKIKNTALPALLSLVLAAADVPAMPQQPGVSPGPGTRYATDAYPGFDDDDELLNPTRKEPKWFGWFTGPEMDAPAAQLEYARMLAAKGSYSSAARELDALVRQWPLSPEAPTAQLECANILFNELGETEEAFSGYRYLADFYSLQCDYRRVTDLMYEAAKKILADGKEIVFVRFENTVDARRAFEAAILRAPGAPWAPEAMLTVASLREKEGRLEQAVKVYENLRSLYASSPEASTALAREASVRMRLLDDHGYNRFRCRDTVDFLVMALRTCAEKDAEEIRGYLASARALMEREAYNSARFYDSKTRTRRSAVNAYEKFLAEYPDGVHAAEVKARLEELKGEGK